VVGQAAVLTWAVAVVRVVYWLLVILWHLCLVLHIPLRLAQAVLVQILAQMLDQDQILHLMVLSLLAAALVVRVVV
jgi:hypothetical protein